MRSLYLAAVVSIVGSAHAASGKPLMDTTKTMYPNANTTVVDADHRIQVSTPEAVVAAIRRVMPPADAPGC